MICQFSRGIASRFQHAWITSGYFIFVSEFKFLRHEYYVTNSSNITQDNSCIVDDKDLHPCFSLDGMADYLHFIPCNISNISNISIYFLSEYYPVYGNMTFLFEAFTVVHLRPWEMEVK